MPKLYRSEEEVLMYLDKAIRAWRRVRRGEQRVCPDLLSAMTLSQSMAMAIHYLDAFQSVRLNLFGETLADDAILERVMWPPDNLGLTAEILAESKR